MIIKDTTSSTNDDIRALAGEGAPEWTAVMAKKQTEGRGQVGRIFYSPEGGLYMSILLRPELRAEKMCLITTAAAVAAAGAIEKVFGIETQVKWVNDLYYNGRKVCGILTEAVLREDGYADYVILGIGINVVWPDGGFPQKIEGVAGALLEKAPDPDCFERLALEITEEFRKLYDALPDISYREEYVRRMGPVGQTVSVRGQDGRCFRAQIEGVDSEFRLILRKDGETVIIGEKNRISY